MENLIKEWCFKANEEYFNRDKIMKDMLAALALGERKESPKVDEFLKISRLKLLPTTYCPYTQHVCCMEQNTENICGFYTFYNIVYFLKFLFSSDINQKLKCLFKLHNRFNFWIFHKSIVEYLVTMLKAEDRLYEIEELVKYNVMERYQMEYLFDTHPQFLKLKKRYTPGYFLEVQPVFFGFNNFQMSGKRILEIQKSIDAFLKTEQDGALVFVLGILNHWLAMVVHKSRGEYKFYLLDSLAYPYLGMSEETLFENTEAYAKKILAIRGYKWIPQRFEIFLQQLKDTRTFLYILYKTMSKAIRLPELHIDIQLRIFWRDYNVLFQELLKSNDLELSVKPALFDASSLSIEDQLKIFRLEYNAAFQSLLSDSEGKKMESLKGVHPSWTDIEQLEKVVKEASDKKAANIGIIQYYWLLYHKPKHIADTILEAIIEVGAQNIPENWRKMLLKWGELQGQIYTKVVPHLVEGMGTKENPILDLHLDFLEVVRKIANAVSYT